MPRAASPKSCPLCGEPPSARDTPFCSPGCRDRDLLNWLGDGYRVPGPPAEQGGGNSERDGLDSDC